MNEAVLTQEAKDAMGWLDYPKYLAGERACPPEDCGSVDGYYRIVSILRDPNHDEYEEYVERFISIIPGRGENMHFPGIKIGSAR